MKAIDISLPIKSKGTAYYRIDEQFKTFLEKCSKEHGIIGFEWDKNSPWNFGVILKK